jgi:uncharacterized phage-associated protein
MIAYQKEKVENAVCFFASKHKEYTGKNLYQTSLFKYLALFEFEYLKKHGRPPLGLKYLAMEKGPVPVDIYKERDHYKTSCAYFKKVDENKFIVISTAKPDMDYFSPSEMDEMVRLIKIYADEFVRTKTMSEATHHEIKAWRETYQKNPNGEIDFKLTFERDFEKKESKDHSIAEESFLIYKAIEEAGSH